MSAVRSFAERGGPVLGICNGFQVLLERACYRAPWCGTAA
jgi:phosphoribosylformylglycinamidine (FGAM) synthase-like amidotransferase family enzyme